MVVSVKRYSLFRLRNWIHVNCCLRNRVNVPTIRKNVISTQQSMKVHFLIKNQGKQLHTIVRLLCFLTGFQMSKPLHYVNQALWMTVWRWVKSIRYEVMILLFILGMQTAASFLVVSVVPRTVRQPELSLAGRTHAAQWRRGKQWHRVHTSVLLQAQLQHRTRRLWCRTYAQHPTDQSSNRKLVSPINSNGKPWLVSAGQFIS